MENIINKERLKIYANEYMHITNEIITFLINDNLEEAEKLIEKRDVVVENIKLEKYTTEEFIEVFNSRKISELENNCSFLIKEKLQNTKEKLRDLKIAKAANENYSKYGNKNLTFLNKKV